MDVFALVRDYVDRLIPADGSMKCLLLDQETIETVSVVFGHSHLLERGVFLVDQVQQTDRTAVYAMRCIIFVRPTTASVRAIEAELAAGHFQSYTLGFANAISTDLLNRLAAADVHERVVRVEECFADFTAINRDLVLTPVARQQPGTFALPPPSPLTTNSINMNDAYLTRVVEGITASCLALRRRPLFRFAGRSPLARQIAAECVNHMRADPELYNFQARDTVLLIVDRVDDVLTPLLTPWTYQAMLAEHLDMHNNRLLLPGDAPVEERGFVFGQQDDSFFATNMYASWGDVCTRVHEFVSQTKEQQSMEGKSMAQIREMAQQLAVNQQTRGSAQKHINCMTTISDMIKARTLYQISTFEQRMLVDNSAAEHWNEIVELTRKQPPMQPCDTLRLCMLYHLKYERALQGSKAAQLLQQLNVPGSDGAIARLRNFIGPDRDMRTCLGSSTAAGSGAAAAIGGALSSLLRGFTDVQTVRTQHEPLLKKQLVALSQNRLEADAYPYVTPPANAQFRPREVVVFVVGGCTMEEASMVATLQNPPAGTQSPVGDMRILLMAPNVLTSKQFVAALENTPGVASAGGGAVAM